MDLSKLRGPKETIDIIEAFPASEFYITFMAQMRYFDHKLREALIPDCPKLSYSFFEDDERERAERLRG